MNCFSAYSATAMRPALRHWVIAPLAAVALLVLVACNGTAVVTLTATASTDTFSPTGDCVGRTANVKRKQLWGGIACEHDGGSREVGQLSEVLGSTTVAQANYTTAIITVDSVRPRSCTTTARNTAWR